MGRLQSLVLGVIFFLIQTFRSGFCEDGLPCQPSFDSAVFVFSVYRKTLNTGTRLGKVHFDDCGGPQKVLIQARNFHIKVDSDGTVHLNRPTTLHSGEKNFTISILGSKSERKSATVRVVHLPSPEKTPVLLMPHSSKGLKRRKRDWLIPPIRIPENSRGPFPQKIVRMRSSHGKKKKVQYSITGPGADQPALMLFTIDKDTGWLSVIQSLDREKDDKYILFVHAVAEGDNQTEEALEIVIFVSDQNDNKPEFTKDLFLGSIAESSPRGFEFMRVTAVDKDEPGSFNSDIRYKLLTQDPESPEANMFLINSITGGILLNSGGLDREKISNYTLVIQASDMEGEGLSNTCTAIITVISNDDAPKFVPSSYTVSVPENEVGALVVKMPVTDGDEPHTPAWSTKYKIIEGNNGGFFSVSTGPSMLEGIITTAKGLDFEKDENYTLLVTVENDAPFGALLPTSTATVTVNVVDGNDAPVFNPVEKVISKPEILKVGADLIVYTATDPDATAGKSQKMWYKSGHDPAGWLSINNETGLIKIKSPMDKDSPFVEGGRYRALILAIDDDDIPATGTGTLLIELEEVKVVK
ncbi:cadherin-4-like [Conger conger]|uniref:cadherin-4-like n=1 Tax=Conger conger TaxID=82655 RepID=UPI002A5A9643|nr:cadherin-4-like [Conger conger]